VTRELFRTRVEGWTLGNIRFDENGDLVEVPVRIFCIAAAAPSWIGWWASLATPR
jgi:hypothetical protein